MSEDNIPRNNLMTEAKRKRLRREDETPEERALRQGKQRERQRSLRQNQSEQESSKYREYHRILQESRRRNEIKEQTAERLDYIHKHQANVRYDETMGYAITLGIDTVIVDCIDANNLNWNVRQNYIQSQLEVPTQSDAIFEGQNCVAHTVLSLKDGTDLIVF